MFNTPNPESRRIPDHGGGKTSDGSRTILPQSPQGAIENDQSPGRGPEVVRAVLGRDSIDLLADELAEQSGTLEARGLATSHTSEYFRWRYGFEPLHYRVIRTKAASAVVRVRQRGPAVRCRAPGHQPDEGRGGLAQGSW